MEPNPASSPSTAPAANGFPGADRWWWAWILAGVAYGILMRVLFGLLPAWTDGAMSLGFLVGTPLAAGALSVWGVRRHRPGVLIMIVGPWLTIGLMLVGCSLAMLEGLICIALMSPLFLGLGSIGGLLMGGALALLGHRRGTLPAFALLPLLLVLGEQGMPMPDAERRVEHAVDIAAPPARVWAEILSARDIRADELPPSLTHAIGVPRPLEGVNLQVGEAEVRFSRWERGVTFRGIVTAREEARRIAWRYAFDDHSFPPGSMDDHVAIGGRDFDLHDTEFSLEPLADGGTRLRIVARYRVSSRINAYAVPVADLIGRDFVATILGLYKHRSERTPG